MLPGASGAPLVAALLHVIGVWKGEEKLFAFAAALATQSDQFDRIRLLVDMRKLKEYYQSLGPVEHKGPLEYPETPQDFEFQTNYPEICMAIMAMYGASPVASKWDFATRRMFLVNTPCRKTGRVTTGVQVQAAIRISNPWNRLQV